MKTFKNLKTKLIKEIFEQCPPQFHVEYTNHGDGTETIEFDSYQDAANFEVILNELTEEE